MRILIKSYEIEGFFLISQKWLNIGNCTWFNLSGIYAREWLFNDFKLWGLGQLHREGESELRVV